MRAKASGMPLPLCLRRLGWLGWFPALLLGCSGDPVGGDDPRDAAPDGRSLDSGHVDAAVDGSPGDAGPPADAGLDGGQADGATDPCGGACLQGLHDPCTCAAVDPCGWQGNGVCDDACRAVLPGTFFPDLVDCDLDLDGLYDCLEAELATQFEPYLWLSHKEEGYRDDRLPHFAVAPIAGPGVSIFYALAYYRDYGDPDLFGLTSHPGDSEVIVVEVSATGPGPQDGPWALDRLFLSAHYGTATDGSGWFGLADIQVHADASGSQHPVVYVAEWKHANYRSLSACDAGALGTDHCEEFLQELVGIAPARNLGSPLVPFLDDVLHDGNHEFFWSPIHFCGWQEASLSNADRGACPGLTSTYEAYLGRWLDGTL